MKSKVIIGSILLSCLAAESLLCPPPSGRGRGGGNRNATKAPMPAAPDLTKASALAARPANPPAVVLGGAAASAAGAATSASLSRIPVLLGNVDALAKQVPASANKDFFVPGVDGNLQMTRSLLELISKEPDYQLWLSTADNKTVFKALCEKAWPVAHFVKKSWLSFLNTDTRPDFVTKLK